MYNIKEIINNRNIEATPKNLYKYLILFIIMIFILGFFIGYLTCQQIIYLDMKYLIDNNGILIFDNEYYKFIKITSIWV